MRISISPVEAPVKDRQQRVKLLLALMVVSAALSTASFPASAAAPAGGLPAAASAAPPGLSLSGDLTGVHDPAIIREGDTWSLFSTSHLDQPPGLIHIRTSSDLRHWSLSGAVFRTLPVWADERVPGTRGLWAPDIVRVGDEYRLYYSVSTFGRNRSAIGLAVSPTLDPQAPEYGWVDKGIVFASSPDDDFNAIDPNVLVTADGAHWMAFGSFWSGLKMIALAPASGLAAATDTHVVDLAERSSPGAVEAPFLIERAGHFYLFGSFDFCCRGADSSYYTVVGRSDRITGPYLDRDGVPMLEGGGSVVLHADQDPTGRFAGPGHVAVLRDHDRYYIVHHAYDKQADGASTLRIRTLSWTGDGWPVAE